MTTPTLHRDPRAVLSMLWVYVLLNTLFRDIHEFFRDGFIEEVISGRVNGTELTMVTAALVLQLPLSMVVLSRILPRHVNRLANIAISVLTGASVVGTWPKDADDIAFAVFATIGLLAIIAYSWTWQPRPVPPEPMDHVERSELSDRPS